MRKMEYSSPKVLTEIDNSKTRMCMFVNSIHSYDGAINTEIILNFKKLNKNIASIHDC